MKRVGCPECGRETVATIQSDRERFYWNLRSHKPCGAQRVRIADLAEEFSR